MADVCAHGYGDRDHTVRIVLIPGWHSRLGGYTDIEIGFFLEEIGIILVV
jgi:hypothetical protein